MSPALSSLRVVEIPDIRMPLPCSLTRGMARLPVSHSSHIGGVEMCMIPVPRTVIQGTAPGGDYPVFWLSHN